MKLTYSGQAKVKYDGAYRDIYQLNPVEKLHPNILDLDSITKELGKF